MIKNNFAEILVFAKSEKIVVNATNDGNERQKLTQK